jgi:hypothetical protein
MFSAVVKQALKILPTDTLKKIMNADPESARSTMMNALKAAEANTTTGKMAKAAASLAQRSADVIGATPDIIIAAAREDVLRRRQTAGGKKKKQKQKKKSKKYMKKTKKKPKKKSKKKKQTSTSVSSILKRGNRKSKGKKKKTVRFKGKKSSRRTRAGMASWRADHRQDMLGRTVPNPALHYEDPPPEINEFSEDEWRNWVYMNMQYVARSAERARDEIR